MKWLRKLIGTEDIYNQINDLNHYITGLRGAMSRLDTTIAEPLANLTAILCSEFSEARKAASDRLGAEALKRMAAEAKARAPYNIEQDPTDGQ